MDKGEWQMFPDELQIKLYECDDIQKIPIVYVFTVLSALQEVCEENGYDFELHEE